MHTELSNRQRVQADSDRANTLRSKFAYPSAIRSLKQQGLSKPEFCGDLVYKLRKFVEK